MSSVNNTVAVVDYEMGNLRSVSQAVMTAAQGTDVRVIVTQDPAQVRAASRIVLPGQGAMRDCMAALQASGLKARPQRRGRYRFAGPDSRSRQAL